MSQTGNNSRSGKGEAEQAGHVAPVNRGSATATANDQPARRLFRISLYIKGFDSLVELLIGVLLFVVPGQAIVDLAMGATRFAFTGHPEDVLSTWLTGMAQSFSVDQTSRAALYLFSHGAVKLFLVAMLLQNRLWAYPVFLVVMTGFVTYQVYQLMLAMSGWLVFLTAFDVFVILLTLHEYRYRRLHPDAGS